jgi:site-specific DNA recombinase
MDAIGIVRVSRVAGREGESFVSPVEQRERIEAECKREGLRLLRIEEELDVSGGSALAKRPGLIKAVEAVEAGEASVIVAAYFDRLYRSLDVQAQVGKRVEDAGGRILTVDAGYVGQGTSSEWLNATVRGMMAEYYRRQMKERSGEAMRLAVQRGVAILAYVPPGYLRGEDGKLIVDPLEGSVMTKAFEMRAEGREIIEVKAFMAEHGIARAWDTIYKLLSNRVYRGEIRFGKLINDHAHDPLVDEATFRRCQKRKPSPGRPAQSKMLLARLRIVRCGSCGRAMVTSNQKQRGKRYGYYKCPSQSDCGHKVAINEKVIDPIVTEKVREALAELHGHASADSHVEEADAQLEAAQKALEAAIRAFDGLDEAAARERIDELREVRDAAQAERDQLGGRQEAQRIINALDDWDRLTYDERRALIKATVQSVEVFPATAAGVPGPERVAVKLFTQDTSSSRV